jgi:hypothetical protein
MRATRRDVARRLPICCLFAASETRFFSALPCRRRVCRAAHVIFTPYAFHLLMPNIDYFFDRQIFLLRRHYCHAADTPPRHYYFRHTLDITLMPMLPLAVYYAIISLLPPYADAVFFDDSHRLAFHFG